MRADHVEISWDDQEGKWLLRVAAAGVIFQQFSEQPQDIDHITLQTEAVDLAAAQGYAVDRSQVVII